MENVMNFVGNNLFWLGLCFIVIWMTPSYLVGIKMVREENPFLWKALICPLSIPYGALVGLFLAKSGHPAIQLLCLLACLLVMILPFWGEWKIRRKSRPTWSCFSMVVWGLGLVFCVAAMVIG